MPQKKRSNGELEILAVVWGLERIRSHIYGKQIQLFPDHQALEPLLKRNEANEQYSARLTRWLDRLNHFDISLKHTAGKEIKFTDFISRNPTENSEPEKNCEEEFVINAIAQIATVNARNGGQNFNQSDSENAANEANMRDTRPLNDTRLHHTNKSYIDSNYRAQQLYSNTDTSSIIHYQYEMNNDQIARYFRMEGQLRYHWGADQEIMAIINRSDNTPETSELVTRRLELTKTGALRPHWNKNLGREIYVPRRSEENERKEIK